jgi:hypothetical protein
MILSKVLNSSLLFSASESRLTFAAAAARIDWSQPDIESLTSVEKPELTRGSSPAYHRSFKITSLAPCPALSYCLVK